MKNEEITKDQLLKELAKLRREITQVKEETERKKEEEIVIPSEESFQNLIESFNEVIYRADPITLCATYVNRAIEILYGYTVEEWIGNPHLWEQTIHSDDKEHVFSAVSEAQNLFNNTVLEYRIRRKDGSLRWVRDNISWERDHMGNVSSLIGVIYDITERKKTQDAIEKIFNMTGYMVCIADLKGYFTRVNKSFEQILGYTSEELLGQPYINFIHPDDKQKTLDVIENEMSQGVKIVGFENRYRCKDRRYKWLSWTAQPDPKTGNSYAIAYDITDRKKAHEELAKSEERFRLLSQTSPVGVFMTDNDGKTTYWNDRLSEITGMTAKQAKGTGWADAIHPDDIEGVFDEWYRSAEARANFKAKYRFVDRQGNETWTIGQAVPMINDKNELIGYFGTITDINDLKKAEQEQERLTEELIIKNKELEQVLYVTSHDLRSPLVNIDGYGKELEYSLKDLMSSIDHADVPSSIKDKINPIVKEDIPESLHYILISISKMNILLKGILTLSRLGSAELTTEKIDMNEMMNDIVDSHRFRLNELKMKTEISSLPNCKGDSTQINQVFSNLLDNSLKYTDTEWPGLIKISGYKDKTQAVYCIEDNGIGISPEHQDKIFEIFHQLEPNRVKGEGMGLTIAHRIIEKHNGNIWVESELGKGSKFFVSLPS